MKKIKLTKIAVEKLPFADKGKQVDYYDSELDGFGVRVSATGKKYFVRAHIGSRRIRVMMKSAQLISAEEARREAKAKIGTMAQGIDPNQVERERIRLDEEKRQEEAIQGITLQEALEAYIQKGNLKPRTMTTYQDLFRLYLADWLTRPAMDITRDMVKTRHLEIATGQRQRQAFKRDSDAQKTPDTKRREGAADNCMRTLRAVLNYAFDDEEGGTAYLNPCNILSSKKRKAWFKVERRQTLIKNSDLHAWGKAVMALENDTMRDFLLFLIFTGLRRNEAARLKWSQVDFQEGCFTIPDTKNGDPHTLPLSDHLYGILAERKDGPAGSSVYVFPGPGEAGHLQEPKRAIQAVTDATGIKFTCHDLRRTFATLAEGLDLSIYTVKALLNHRQPNNDVTGGYIQIETERLREPMQKITIALLERIQKQYGRLLPLQAKVSERAI